MSRLTRLSLTNRTVILLLALLTIGMGVYTAGALKQELIPSIDLPRASVIAVYPGASPEAVERDVTKPLESAVSGVSGITSVTSTSSSGVAQLRAEWDFNSNADKIQNDLRSAVDATRTRLPTDVTPTVVAGSFDDIPIAIFAISGDGTSTDLAREVKDTVLPRLKGIAGVRDATLTGEQTQQVNVTLNQKALLDLGVDQTLIGQMFTASSTSVPAGSIRTGKANVDVQVGTAYGSVEDVKNLRVQGTDGPVKLSQVATVALAPVDTTSISRVNGKASLTLAVTKERTANTVTVAQAVRAAIPGLAQQLGHNATVATVFDQSPFIEQSVHDLSVEGGLGLLMAVLVIMVFLWSVRPTLITAISIPLSLFIALIGLWVGSYSLNILTLGALTVAIGRVVDDSIVVIENIKRHQGLGEYGFDSIVGAVKEVAGAVTSSTLTTVAVFLPIGLVGGQSGQLFRPFAVTVTISLLASLLVSLTVIPVLASWFMNRGSKHEKRASATSEDQAEEGDAGATAEGEQEGVPADDPHERSSALLQRAYLPALRFSLGHRVLTIVVALVIFGGTLALVPHLKTDFIGEAGQSSLVINQDLPSGTSLENTDAAAKKVEAVLAADPDVETYQTSIGGSTSVFLGNQTDTNHAGHSVTLKPKVLGTEVVDRLRTTFAGMRDIGRIEVSVGRQSSQVVVYVEGNDPDQLAAANGQVLTMLQGLGNLTDVKSDLGDARAMLTVDVDEDKAAAAGMTQAQVGLAVLRAVRGQKVGTITAGDTTYDVMLRSQAPVTTTPALSKVVLPLTAKQTMDTRKAAADRVEARTKKLTAQSKADQKKAYDEQLASLRSNRSKAVSSLSELQATLAMLQKALAAGPPPVPVMPDPLAGVKAQIAQVQAGITAAKGQITAIDTSIDKLAEQRTKALEATAAQESIQQAAKDAQKATATPATLADVAKISAVNAPAVVTRVDGARTATLTATPAATDLGATTTAITTGLAALTLPPGVTARIGGVSQQQQESFAQLGLAMLVAIAIVYLIMVATFGSLVQPLMLLVSIPFAATGAIGLSLVTDTPLGVPSMIGLLMLIGIVVTNAIVLIDLINQYRDRGADVGDAILHGARLRLRPIIMTAAATIFALIPMGLGVTGGGVFISKPLAIVVIGGLVSSTVLTLILVPVLYEIVESLRSRRGRRERRALSARQQLAG